MSSADHIRRRARNSPKKCQQLTLNDARFCWAFADLLIYGDFMVPGAEPKIYCEVSKAMLPQLLPIVNEYLADYNAESKTPMNLVLFNDAIKHVSRVNTKPRSFNP